MWIQRYSSICLRGFIAVLASGLMVYGISAQAFEDDLDFAQVIHVVATQERGGTWRFDVTVEHNDEGWDHYADAWEVVNHETGEVLAERVLLHPHVNEMPFTRSESRVSIPADLTLLRVRARCTVHGFGGYEVVVDLSEAEGERFTVRR